MKSPIIEVLYEDAHLLALSKPAGVHSVRLPQGGGPSVADWLLERDPAMRTASPKVEDAGLIQRLDLETSGVLIAAKSLSGWQTLHATLTAGSIDKRYLILVEGVAAKPLTISGWIGSPYRRAGRVRVYGSKPPQKSRALPAETVFTPIGTDPERRLSLLEAKAYSARRHQVRAHAGALGHALVGDEMYGSKRALSELGGEGLPAFLLHAHVARFISPFTAKELILQAPLPEYASGLFSPEWMELLEGRR